MPPGTTTDHQPAASKAAMRQRPVTPAQTIASGLTIVLAAIASAAGLFVPHLYRDAPVLLPQVYGQDLLTLTVAVPALAISLALARRESPRAYVVWLGLTGYILYTYASYAFMTAFNELYLVYTTLLWLSLYTFVSGMARIDAQRLKSALDDHRVWPYVAFELLLAALVGMLWLSEILPATLAGTTPPSIADTGLQVNVIHSLDLGVILPAFVLTAYWLWNRRAWGYAFTAVLLAKGATLGLAILSMVVVMTWSGQAVPFPQVVIFALVTLASLGLLARLLLAIEAGASVPTRSPQS